MTDLADSPRTATRGRGGAAVPGVTGSGPANGVAEGPRPDLPPQLVVEDLTVRYGTVTALDGVDLALPVGEQLAIVGPSGCGKSTLVRAIAGLVPADAGRIVIAGREVAGPGHWLPPEERGVGVVFQDHALFPHLDVRANVAFGLSDGGDADRRIAEVLTLAGLSDLADRYPHELSGGEQQRTALARALAPRPDVLLLDEPFSNLDRNLRERIRRETVSLLRAEGITAIFVTHDRDEALTVGSRVAVVRAGRIEQVASPEAVYHEPASRFVATFLDEAGFVPGRLEGTTAHTPLGRVQVHPAPGPAPVAEVDVMVRAHEVAIEPDPAGNGVVVATEFRGGAVAHVVEVAQPSPDGEPEPLRLVGLRSHVGVLARGTPVRVGIDDDHPLTTFPRGAQRHAAD